MKCNDCGKDIGDSCYSDNPMALTHPHLGGRYCRECYIKDGHPECINPKCDALLLPDWDYCPKCGYEQEREK